MKNILPLLLIALIVLNRKRIMQLTFPLIGKITSRFGERIHPVTGEKTFHNGIDISVPIGTPVKSPLDGKVILVNETLSGGKQLIVKHTNGYRTGYAHLSRINVNVGDSVKKGDIIALSGNTGASTGAHLHLTVTDPLGNKVNPEKYFV